MDFVKENRPNVIIRKRGGRNFRAVAKKIVTSTTGKETEGVFGSVEEAPARFAKFCISDLEILCDLEDAFASSTSEVYHTEKMERAMLKPQEQRLIFELNGSFMSGISIAPVHF